MQKFLSFSRNRCTSVEKTDEETLQSTCHLQDTLTEAEVKITVKLPDLEITDAVAEFRRTFETECLDFGESVKKVVGVRVGPGMLKIIKGLLDESTDCRQLRFMVEECCHGIILALNKDMIKGLEQSTKGQEITNEFYTEMIKANIRLYNRCAAFAPGSPIVEGIEPPE
jgi:hypothetical protein